MTRAEEILNKFIKGDIVRDYDNASRKHHTVTLQTALEAINVALQSKLTRPEPDGKEMIEKLLLETTRFLSLSWRTGMRTQIALPKTEEKLKWFDSGLINSGDFMNRLFSIIEEIKRMEGAK